MVSKHHFPERVLLKKMTDSRVKARNIQDEPGTSYHTRKQGSYQKFLGSIIVVAGTKLMEPSEWKLNIPFAEKYALFYEQLLLSPQELEDTHTSIFLSQKLPLSTIHTYFPTKCYMMPSTVLFPHSSHIHLALNENTMFSRTHTCQIIHW